MAKKTTATSESPVLVTTAHRGVFFGFLSSDQSRESKIVTLMRARCAIYFGTTNGFMELAATGPTSKSRIGAEAPKITLQDVTSVTEVSAEATDKWTSA